MLTLETFGPVDAATVARLAPIVAHHGGLRDIVAWMAALGGRPRLHAIVDQDEFTNDVVVEESPGVWLVYDCT